MDLEQRMEMLLNRRKQQHSFRQLSIATGVDFCSNDYLGLARDTVLHRMVEYAYKNYTQLGSTGSRLLTGHSKLCTDIEHLAAAFHDSEAALLFNSGYDANLALLSALPRRNDLILCDALVHASVHDGIKMSQATHAFFEHNDVQALAQLLEKHQATYTNIFVVVESIYSMDGDKAPLEAIAALCMQFGAYFIVDEAHGTGVFGPKGQGCIYEEGLQSKVFARLHTFGKAMGGHGAVVLGSNLLRDFLINFGRSLMYTTALPVHSLITAQQAYLLLEKEGEYRCNALRQRIAHFQKQSKMLKVWQIIDSSSSIQSILVPGNAAARMVANTLQKQGLDVRAILAPTVPSGQERLRVCLHVFNTLAEIDRLIEVFCALEQKQLNMNAL